jgi:hypothetical protein
MRAIAETQKQVAAGAIDPAAAGLDLARPVMADKIAALFVGWPDEWGGRAPQGFVKPEHG